MKIHRLRAAGVALATAALLAGCAYPGPGGATYASACGGAGGHADVYQCNGYGAGYAGPGYAGGPSPAYVASQNGYDGDYYGLAGYDDGLFGGGAYFGGYGFGYGGPYYGGGFYNRGGQYRGGYAHGGSYGGHGGVGYAGGFHGGGFGGGGFHGGGGHGR